MKRMRQFLMAIFATMLPLAAAWADNVAKIGDKEYETLEAAFAAAQDGETITVLADCSGNGIKAPQGKFTTGLTVDFANHTYTVDGTTVGSTGTETNGFQLLKDNTITFKNGTITSAKAKILIQNYSNLTLKDMTLTLDNSSYASAYTLSNNNGNIAIDGTTINANPAGGFAFDVCRYASYPSVNVEVKGASVINGNVEIYASGSDAKDGFSLKLTSGELKGNIVVDPSAAAAMAKTPEKTVVTKSDTFKQDAPEGYKWQSDGNGNSTLVACEYVAQIGTVKYEKLAEAFAAAQDGETITLLADCTGDGIVAAQGKYKTNGLTVDFNGHTYTVDGATVGSTGTETNGFQLLKDNTITFKNGTITSAKAKILIQNYSNLTLKDMTLTLDNSSYASAYTLSNNNGNIAIDGTTINANPAGGFAFDVCRYASYPSVNVEVKGASVINGNVEIYASGSDAKDGFSLKLTSGTLTGNIVVDPSAAAAMAATPAKAVVTKSNTFEQAAPEGYKWQSDGTGTSTSTLVPLPMEEQDIVLKDGEAYTVTTNTQVGSATYMRTFGAERVGKYQAWFVPFDHVITAEDAAAFKFYKINLIANANDPNSTNMDTEKVWIFLDEIAEGTPLYANRPYIFKPLAEQTDYKFVTENALLKAINTTSRLHNETSDNTYDFYGSYATNKVTDSSWMYYVDIYGKIGFSKSMTVGSYRWYIRTASKTGEENYARSIVFVDGSETSGITSARMESLPEGIYTLNGVKVERPVKGVYLVKKADGSIKKVSTK